MRYGLSQAAFYQGFVLSLVLIKSDLYDDVTLVKVYDRARSIVVAIFHPLSAAILYHRVATPDELYRLHELLILGTRLLAIGLKLLDRETCLRLKLHAHAVERGLYMLCLSSCDE